MLTDRQLTDSQLQEWFAARIPGDWFTQLDVTSDRDEILVVGHLPAAGPADDAGPAERTATARAAIAAFRKATREERIHIAAEAEHGFGRKVSWGAHSGDEGLLFTHLAIPTMTRLRMAERRVLDTLIEAGVARSRSEALAWCVRQVGLNQSEWLDELKDALSAVEDVRKKGPA